MSRIVPNVLSNSAERHKDKPAVEIETKSISYGDLDILSNQIANTLIHNGVRRGDRVGIFINKSVEAIAVLFGVMKADAICVPLDPNGPVQRLGYIIGDCQIELLITDASKKRKLDTILPKSKSIRRLLVLGDRPLTVETAALEIIPWGQVTGASDTLPVQKAIDADLAYIFYTSGSTGKPKGVMVSHRNILAFVNWACRTFEFSDTDRVSSHAPLHFDMSLFDLYATLNVGATVCLVPQSVSFIARDLIEFITEQKISIWQSVPSVLVLILDKLTGPGPMFSSLRAVSFAGEMFPPAKLRALMEKVPTAQYFNIYGATEINDVTCYPITDLPTDKAIPIGKACWNTEVFALDEDGNEIKGPGVPGELYVRGSTIAVGYWNDPAMTAERFIQNPLNSRFPDIVYRTGDMAELDENGNFCYLGRKDAQIKIRGYRVNLLEVEDVVRQHPCVSEAAVVDLCDQNQERFLKVFLVLTDPDGLAFRDLKKHCLEKLPNYMIPDEMEQRNRLPTTSTGKIDKQQLKRTGP